MSSRKLSVFLCHAKEDKPIVRELYRQLTAEGWMDVWLDVEKLLPGQEWDIEIEKAVEQADVVIVCLSTHSVDKEGYVQKELRFVLNIAEEKPEGTIFVVPLRLDECQVPRRIRAWQYVDYFPKNNRKWAYQRLLESLKLRAEKLGISFEKPVLSIALVEDEAAKAERERKAREEHERLAAQKAETDRIAREKVEAERIAKTERDRLAQKKAGDRRKAITEAFRKINVKPILAVGGIILACFAIYSGGKFILENLPSIPIPTQTSKFFTGYPPETETLNVSTVAPTRYQSTEALLPPLLVDSTQSITSDLAQMPSSTATLKLTLTSPLIMGVITCDQVTVRTAPIVTRETMICISDGGSCSTLAKGELVQILGSTIVEDVIENPIWYLILFNHPLNGLGNYWVTAGCITVDPPEDELLIPHLNNAGTPIPTITTPQP